MRTAIVTGAGPAGSVAALLLARAGWRVTLVEQHRFPREKVCGECVSALGAAVLDRAQILGPLLARGAVRLDRTLLHAPSGTTARSPLPRPVWGVSRAVLDCHLLGAAAAAGVTLLQPARCEALAPGDRPAVRLRDLSTNQVSAHDADVVLVADGKAALYNDGPPPPTADLGIKAHFENVDGPRDAVELFGLSDCYGGLAPIEGGRWNAALSVPAARVRRHRGDIARLFAELLEENAALRRRLCGARQLGRWLASPLPRFAVRRDWPVNVIPIGNAAAAIEPIGGEGIGLALRSAELAAEALAGRMGRWTSRDGLALARQYRRLWGSRRLACRAGAVLASARLPAAATAAAVSRVPALLRAGMALMGK